MIINRKEKKDFGLVGEERVTEIKSKMEGIQWDMQHHTAFMQYLALQTGLQSEHCYWIYYESLNFFVSLVHSKETTNILFRKTVANKSFH